MNILFCGSIDLSLNIKNNNNIAANTTIKYFKKALENNGHKVLIFGMDKDFNFMNKNICQVGSNIIYKPYFKEKWPSTYKIVQSDSKQIKNNLSNIIIENKITLIITYSTYYPVLEATIKVARFNKIKCLTYGGEHFAINFKNILNTINFYQFLAKKFSYKKFDGHICSTHYHQKTLKKLKIRTIVIPTIAPKLKLNNCENIYSKKRDFKIVWMGKPNTRELLLRIIKATKLSQMEGCRICLYLISDIESKKGNHIDKIKKEIKFSENIFITGFLFNEDKSRLLESADAFIHLRKFSKETFHAFPTRIPEYLAYNKPIILSNCTPFSDYFTHLKDCFFINNKNKILDINKAIKVLYNDHNLCKYIGSNSDGLVNKHFSFEVNGNKLNNFIKYYE